MAKNGIDTEKVKEIFEKISKLADTKNYREFEIAYLIMERLDNVISDKEEITDDIINKVYDISNSVDTLLDSYVNEELDILSQELDEEA